MQVRAIQHSPKLIKYSVIDHLVSSQATVGFFYQYQIDQKILLSGLQQALNDFPLFAGTIERIDNLLYINCNNNGVDFSVIQHDCPIVEALQELFDDTPQKNLFDVIDMKTVISNQTAVLKVKVNYFSDGGMCLGICWHHSVGDMHTFMCFMKAFSNIIAGKNNDVKPLIVEDRGQYLNEQLEDKYNPPPGIRYLTIPDIAKFILYKLFKAKDKIRQQFYFSQDELQAMKQAFIAKNDGNILSTNDVLCAHMFTIITEYDPKIRNRYLSIAVNYRSKTNLPENLLGNMSASVNIVCQPQQTAASIAKKVRNTIDSFATHGMNYFSNCRFVSQKGSEAKMSRFIYKSIDPAKGCLLITNWSKFDVYNINFGQEAPFYFTPIANVPFPWLSAIVEGFSNNGLIFSVVLPSVIAKKLTSEQGLAKIHQYRNSSETLPGLVTSLKWVS